MEALKKVVLSGYYGFNNVGDDAILLSIISALREADSSVHITVLSNSPEQTAAEHNVEAVNRWKLREVARVIRAADAVISGGGSLLQDKTGNRSVWYYSGIMWMAKCFRKPYFIYAQGIGPLSNDRNRRVVKRTLEGSRILTVRDDESKELLREIGVKKQIELVPDPVLGLTMDETYERIVAEPYISVSVRDWPSDFDYKKEVAVALDQLAGEGYKIVFVPMHGEHDEKTSAETLALMKESAVIAPHNGTIKEKVSWIVNSELLIGMRLHALIFAAVGDTPFVALSYDPKIDSFAKLCKQPVAGHVNQKWTATQLVKDATEQLKNQTVAVDHMLSYTQQAKTQAKETAKTILNDVK